MNSNCSECVHNHVCKCKDDLKIFIEKVNDLKQAVKGDGVDSSFLAIDINVSCKFFTLESKVNYKFMDATRPSLRATALIDHCVNCPNKPDFTKVMPAGDTPCTFCPYNPYRATCISATIIKSR